MNKYPDVTNMKTWELDRLITYYATYYENQAIRKCQCDIVKYPDNIYKDGRRIFCYAHRWLTFRDKVMKLVAGVGITKPQTAAAVLSVLYKNYREDVDLAFQITKEDNINLKANPLLMAPLILRLNVKSHSKVAIVYAGKISSNLE